MAGLEMETSKAEPADRNQAKSKLNRDAYVDNFPNVESYVDSNPYVESNVDRFAYSTGCVLGKWVCPVTLAMSLFDLQDVCIVIGSLATLDLPMVVDLIGIYVLKGPYSCAAPPLQTPSRPPRHRRAVAVRLLRDRTCSDHIDEEIPYVANLSVLLVQTDEGLVFPVVDQIKENLPPPTLKCRIPCESGRSQAPRRQQACAAPPLQTPSRPPRHRRAAVVRLLRDRTCSDHVDEEIPSMANSSVLLVQTDEGLVFPVMDLIKENLPPPTLKCRIPCESGRSQAPRRQQGNIH
ncbi:hypothetical protein F511_16396 [Dorcoceras hygrometricum]|uniref:Uncharacterized protein n=1 Tax=Dorcoceras hygrometricum TaxID=472368 RepID=A0A2Z7BHQ0_9LAMI|nr:hypothetical protein F511_16396 [Dorcoceras hygrometricum]